MDGTRYVDGVLVDTTQLTRTENSKAFHILRDRLDNWEIGAHSGLRLTVNTVNTSRVDLSAGTGYAINGEYVAVQADQLNIQLADTALGAVNWIVVFYTETKASPNPHETNGTIQPTENKRGFRLRVLKPTDFAALPLTDPTYASDAQDRALLVGIVTGTGGALTTSNIEQPLFWRSSKYAVMATPSLSGVSIYLVSDPTPEGTDGAIKFETAPNRLSWKAPTEGGFGAAVTVTADGFYTLTALGGSTIQVYVVVAGLPLANTVVTVAIRGLYTQNVPRMSSTDRHHRSMLGTGVPTPSNPHGLSIDDISPGYETDLTLHQQLMHANGIWRGSAAACLQVSIDEAPNPDRLLITAPAGNDCYWVHGVRLTAIKNTVLELTSLPTKRSLFEVYVDNVGNVRYSQRVEHTGTLLTGSVTGVVYLNDEVLSGVHTLQWVALGPGAGGVLSWDGSTGVAVQPGFTSGLILLHSGKQQVWFYIGDIDQLPAVAGVYVDNITVFAPPDRAENLVLAHVFYDADLHLGYTNNRGAVPGLLVDLRQFGTLQSSHLRDDTVRDVFELPMDEHHANGVAVGRLDLQTASLYPQAGVGLTVSFLGQAPVYVRGRRHIVGTPAASISVAVPDDDATLIYVDIDGNIAQTKLVWAVALLSNVPNAFESVKFYQTLTHSYTNQPWVFTGTPLALAVSAGGAVTRVVDLRRNLAGGNVNVRPWTVGGSALAQTTEFYSFDAALIYALVQGQESLECVNAVLPSPTTGAPHTISASLTLTGSFALSANWSALSAVFRLANGANITFQDVRISRAGGFIGASTLALVETSAGATTPSNVVFDNVKVDWLTNGQLARFIAAGPANCILTVDDVAVEVDATCLSLFHFGVATTSFIRGLRTLGTLGPVAVISALINTTTSMSNCLGNAACSVATLAIGHSLGGTFVGLDNFASPLIDGDLQLSQWTACDFVTMNVASVALSVFTGCRFNFGATIGSAGTKSGYVQFSGCSVGSLIGGLAKFYCDNLQISGCYLKALEFGGEHIQVSGTHVDGAVSHRQWASHDVQFSSCSMTAFDHSTVVDLYDWHIAESSVGTLTLRWDTEDVSKFSVSGCSLTGVECRPTTMPAPSIHLDGVISNCSLDLQAANVWLAFVNFFRFVGNKVRCIASWTRPPIQIGQSTVAGNQLNRNIDIVDNSFEIIDVLMGGPNDGAPIVAIENVASSDTCGSIQVCGNRFEWHGASALVAANKVICVSHIADTINGCRYDRNALVFQGDTDGVSFSTTSGVKTLFLRMGLFMSFSSLSPETHNTVINTCSFMNNTLTVYGALGTAGRWIAYDVSVSNNTMVLGNVGPCVGMRAFPAGLGAAFTDSSLNSTIDNS